MVSLALVALPLALAGLDRRFPPDLERVRSPSTLVLAEDGSLLRGFTSVDGYWRLPVRLDEVEPRYLGMLLAYEDRRFYHHPGVDPLALLRALGQWLRHGGVISGGSTLTMQVARLLEPMPRDLSGKLRQMLRAVQLEWRFDKGEILRLYLNLAPYGGNLEGLRSASLAYFGKEPRALTPGQAALLVVLPQAPERLRPDRHPEAAGAARTKVLQRLVMRGVLDPEQAAEAMAEPLPTARQPLPFRAPHLAERLHRTASVHRTLIDARLQDRLEALAGHALGRLPSRANLAVVVVRHQDRAVRGYLGGAAWFSAARAGQLDLAQALRSPGSALKPAIYGLAFDQHLIHPETLLLDRPTRFGDYRPSNFLHAYHGEVSAREALQRSLNVPSVAVLDRLGPARVTGWLRSAGMRLSWPAGQSPGLPLVLGGVGTTLADLVMLYSAIASDGDWRPLRYAMDDPPVPASPLLSPTASWQLRAILAGSAPPVGVPAGSHGIAHKTGTSYGFRDAWALGFDREHTVGVWVGRPDGTPIPGQHGRDTAAPLLFEVFGLLPSAPLGGEPVPVGARRLTHAELPPLLQRLDGRAVEPPLRLSFPVDGSTVVLPAGQTELPLVAEGGQRPWYWLVNGRPLGASRSGQIWWPVDGAGSVRVTVLDATGRSASAEIWIDTP